MANVIIYTKDFCPYCVRAKALFKSLGVAFEEINIEGNPELKDELSRKHHWRTVPMIFVGDRFCFGDAFRPKHDETAGTLRDRSSQNELSVLVELR